MKKTVVISWILVIVVIMCSILSAFFIVAANDNAENSSIIGDVDGDGVISIMDATTIQMHLADLIEMTDEMLARAKVLGNDTISVLDATAIQRYLALLGNDGYIGNQVQKPTEEPDGKYTVTFKDYDGEELSTEVLSYGESANSPAIPDRDGYVFIKWDKSYDNITGDMVITAVYEKISSSPYFIVQKTTAKPGDKDVAITVAVKNNPGIASIALDVDYDKTNLKLTDFSYNTDALVGASTTPFSESAKIPCLAMVSGTKNIDGDWVFATLYFDVIDDAYGTSPISITYDENNVYNIKEDNVEFKVVNGFIIVNQEKEVSSDKHTVVFKDNDGTVLSTQEIKTGDAATPPQVPEKDGYIFLNWDKPFDNITEDTEITAVYQELGETPYFIVDKVSAQAGDKNVEVTIAVKNNPGVSSIALDIMYENEDITLTDFAYNTTALSGASTVPFSPSAFQPCVSMINGTKNITGDWDFVTLYFDVSETAKGTYPIVITYDENNVYDIKEDNVAFEVINGSITIS